MPLQEAYRLSIRLWADGFSFQIHPFRICSPFVPFADKQPSEVLRSYLEQEHIHLQDFASVDLQICRADFELVPTALLRPDEADLWLNFATEHDIRHQHIMQEPIEEYGCTLLYGMDAGIAAWAEQTLPSYTVRHQMEQLLRTAMQRREDTFVIAHAERHLCSLVSICKRQLKAAHSYACLAATDALYWLLLYFQQQQLPTDTPVLLCEEDGTEVQTLWKEYVNLTTYQPS